MPFHHTLTLDQPERLKALKRLHMLGLEYDESFGRMTRLIAKTLSVPAVALTIVDSEEHWLLNAFSPDEDIDSDALLRFAEQTIETGANLIITGRNQQRIDVSALVQLRMSSAVSICLVADDGQILGTLSLFDDSPREWSSETLDSLDDFALFVLNEIERNVQRAEYEWVKTKLEQERDLLRALIDSSPDYIFVKDVDGRFLISNRAHARAAHIENPDDLVGKTAYDTFPSDLAAQYDADDRAVLASGKAFLNLERQTVDYDGNQKWVLTSKVPFVTRDGVVSGLVGISRDISLRKRAEETLREREMFIEQVLMTSPGFVYVYSMEKQINIYSNNAISVILGYTPQEIKAFGTSLFPEIMHPDDLTQLPDQFQKMIDLQDGEVNQWEYRLKRKDGTYGWVLDRAMVFKRDSLGNPLENIGVIIDITQRKLAEARVQSLEQVKTDMIRIAAHDLRNPLTGASGFTQLLRESIKDNMTEQQAAYFDMLTKSLHNMQRIVVDILSLERIESLQEQATYVPLDVTPLVKAIYTNHRAEADQRQHQYQLDGATNPVYVRADEAQLREAIENLITNAIKYTPDGGQISVSLKANGKNAQLSVTDNGYGIPDALQARLFQPFFRAKTAQTRHIEGTGLGLHLVKNIVERHNGHISFQSKIGSGSTFIIEIPLLESIPK
jgi:PAS domain S-box-containing protein